MEELFAMNQECRVYSANVGKGEPQREAELGSGSTEPCWSERSGGKILAPQEDLLTD